MDEELTIREVGERRVVAEITHMMRATSMLVDGFGHDAAFIELCQKDNELLVLNTDRSGLNAAYGLGLAGPECVGDFGVSHAISDIVVAGGVPRAVTVALLLPIDTTLGFVRGVMKGAAEAARRYGAEIVAGDTKQNPKFALVATALGTVPRDKRICRSGARPGDVLVVTGYLGSMMLGLIAFKRALPLDARVRRVVEQAIIEQRPPFSLGRAIAEAGIPHAGTDISDGLPGAIHAICGASDCGAFVDELSIPMHPHLNDLVTASGLSPLQLSIAGGDWQFLYAVPPDHLPMMHQLASSLDAKVTVIGGITTNQEIAIRHSDGAWHLLERLEHDSFTDDGNGAGHFARTEAATARRGASLEGRHFETLWRNLA
ncbi:thiamine-phosphate kinase [Pseudotabrizicola algicola]|uniref:Thiamine-monophosphate kinase n=1 Tax=Pseudotabrizicola algicola TaxID=2709381 RepID=A0A6B3RYN6_9RHOB|nr:thiamine-phosphate kinase [Pseudotabrizicola algicola]NEX48232.1 thiamine-monophosphate kinase [Pseudotabrizicola algicola]